MHIFKALISKIAKEIINFIFRINYIFTRKIRVPSVMLICRKLSFLKDL